MTNANQGGAAFLAGVAGIGEPTLQRVAGLGLLRWIGSADDLTGLAVIPDAATLALAAEGHATVEADLVMRLHRGRQAIRRGVRILVHGYADAGLERIFDIDVHAPSRTPLDQVAFAQDQARPARRAA